MGIVFQNQVFFPISDLSSNRQNIVRMFFQYIFSFLYTQAMGFCFSGCISAFIKISFFAKKVLHELLIP